MPRTPDRSPGEEDQEGTIYENWTAGNDPPTLGGVRLVDGSFRMRDAGGVFDPRTGVAVVDYAYRRHFLLMGA